MGQAVTHCRKAGHEYTPENTYVTKRGHRACVACHKAANEEYERANAEKRKAARRKRYQEEDPEERRAKGREWSAKHRERLAAKAREYRARKKATAAETQPEEGNPA
jgi:hypothetical protein